MLGPVARGGALLVPVVMLPSQLGLELLLSSASHPPLVQSLSPPLTGPFLGALAAVPFHYFYNMKWDTNRGRANKDPLALHRNGSGKSSSLLGDGDVEAGKVRVRARVFAHL